MSRDLMLRFASLGFRVGLFATALTAAFAAVFGSADTIKQALSDSGIYGASKTIAQSQLGTTEITPAIKPAVVEAAANAFTPEVVQSAGEQFVDGTYRWLDGSTKQPDFSIDLTPAVQQLTNTAGDAAAERAKALPACTISDRPRSSLETSDILFLNCLPPGNTPAMIRSETIARLRDSNQFFKQPVITADSLVGNGQSQSPFETWSGLPTSFQMLVFLPWLLLLISLGLAGIVLVIFQDRLKTAYALAKGMLWAGLAVLAVALVAHVIFVFVARQGGPVETATTGSFQPYIVSFLRSLEGSVAKVMLAIGGAYVLVGGVASGVMRRAVQPAEVEVSKAEPESASVAETVAPAAALPHVAPAAPIGSTIQPLASDETAASADNSGKDAKGTDEPADKSKNQATPTKPQE